MTMKLFKYPYPHKPLVLKIMMAILMLMMLESCDDINPFDPFFGFLHDMKNMRI